jgi:hypothetical protein
MGFTSRDLGTSRKISRQHSFALVRILFGLIWLLNTWFQANGAYINRLFLKSFSAGVSGQPEWLGHWTQAVINGIEIIGAARVAAATVLIDALLALSLLTGIWLRFFVWVGIAYNLFMWSTVGGMGGPYTQGATDPGTAIVYALAFVFVLLTRSWVRLSVVHGRGGPDSSARFYSVGRLLFGLLWAFDAFWKWHPYFLQHAVTYLVQSQQGQPAWIVAYIQFFINLFNAVSPLVFGFFAAIVETLIAASLVFNKGLSFMLPIGAVYSLGLWTTAEGWGGPYGPGFTGNRGDILGTTIIYCVIFLYLMVMYPLFPGRKTKAAE